MSKELPQKLMRRLAAAEGYLQLGMPDHALQELSDEAGFGPLEAPALYLRGMAFMAQDDYEQAIPAFGRAARMIPAPYSGPAWMQLSECLRHEGQDALAEVAESFATAPTNTYNGPVINVTINVTVTTSDVEESFDEDEDDDEGESWKRGREEDDDESADPWEVDDEAVE